jgi:hypothetical protein
MSIAPINRGDENRAIYCFEHEGILVVVDVRPGHSIVVKSNRGANASQFSLDTNIHYTRL